MHVSDNNFIVFICRALLPLAEALSNIPTAGLLRSDPNPQAEHAQFVLECTRYVGEYAFMISSVLDTAPTGSVPMPRLRNLLKPLPVGEACITQLEHVFMARLRTMDHPSTTIQW